MSLPLAIQDIDLCSSVYGLEHPAKMEEKLSQHDIASCTAKRHQLVCWQASISVNWAVGIVCKVFACLLGSYLASFGTELLIAALIITVTVSVSQWLFKNTMTGVIVPCSFMCALGFLQCTKSAKNTKSIVLTGAESVLYRTERGHAGHLFGVNCCVRLCVRRGVMQTAYKGAI